MKRECVDHLRDIFQRNAARTLLVDVRSRQEWTYQRFLEDSLAAAAFLARKGVRAGDQVAFSMENSSELAILYFACMHLRAAILPINPAFHANDYVKILQGGNAKLLFASPAVYAGVKDTLATLDRVQVLCFRPGTDIEKKKTQPLVNLDFAECLAGASDASEGDSPIFVERKSGQSPQPEPWGGASDDDIFLTMPTSGSTSTPKVINIAYGGLVRNGLAMARRLGLGRENRFYNVLPMTYLGGFYNLLLIPILAEGSLALDGAFGVPNLYGFWENVETFGVNTLWFTATMLSMLLSLEDDEDVSFLKSRIRIALCGMAPLAGSVKKRFEERFGFFLYENYALSETTFLTTHVPGRPYKEGTVGLPLDGVEVRIVDGQLRPLPPGQDGQVAVRSAYLMKGYRQSAPADQASLRPDGTFLTGDIGHLDDEGELYITGRLKDLIIRGGVNISPKAIEDVFYRLDAVEEAAVVGVPHAVYGEEVAVAIKVKNAFRDKFTVDDAQQYCERNIANFQRPKFIFFIDELPKGATNKIHKTVLRHMIQQKVDPMYR